MSSATAGERIRIGRFDVTWSDTAAASLGSENALLGRAGIALAEIFTGGEQRARTSQAYVRSAVGSRLRVISAEESETTGVLHSARRLIIAQRDERSGLEVRSVLTAPVGTAALRIEHEVRNTGSSDIVLTTVASGCVGFGAEGIDELAILLADSEWLAENRWREQPLRALLPDLALPLHAQDGRGRATVTSHGSWSTGEHLPVGVIEDRGTGAAFAWQIESGAGWHVDLSQDRGGATVGLFGPTDLEHQFAHRLAPGATFAPVPVALTVSPDGRDAALGELTAYRRWLRAVPASESLPIVYNDFMNTLMGQPSSEALRPLIVAAAEAGAEVFCIDAGWFADPDLGDWWSTVGEWREAPSRFDRAGLRGLTGEILARGMRVGLWLEPEVIGVDSPMAARLPEQAFFHRFGARVQEHGRYHLDFRHPAVRAHLDETVALLVREYGVTYLKLDYNINPGAGTEQEATAAGDGLLGHLRALRSWLIEVQRRHPGLLLENCSSGAMRADYALLDVTHMQSTSDQQDFMRYPPIAASAPASILPEQCGNWAYPSAEMSDAETAFTLVTGLSGRLYLSGFLDSLRDSQRALLTQALTLHRDLRTGIPGSTPFWPLGLPGWDDDIVCLGHRLRDGGALVYIWDRSRGERDVVLPGVHGAAEKIFPMDAGGWTVSSQPEGLRIQTAAGVSAGVLRITGANTEEAR
ncbi:MAG: alpha-galactosidase [Actinobacteria bacterium]|nr:alpha-galactosidase [Actinomycetota bacterium]